MRKQPPKAYRGVMRLCCLVDALLVPFSALAQASVDQMTCAQAQRFVHQHGRIYAKTPDGPLPVHPLSSVWSTPYCPGRQIVWPQTYVTREGGQCTVGYMCSASGGGF
jgi:hypothetical protein